MISMANNAVFVRLPDSMLAEVDKIVLEKRVKNRQAVIKEAIAAYLAMYEDMKIAYTNRVNQSQPSPN